MEPLPTVKEQIRENSGGAAGAVFRRVLLWALIFGGATLAWWQISVAQMKIAAILDGQMAWERGTFARPLALATLGVVLAVGFAAITILATDLLSAFVATALLFAPVALFGQWQPLWIWWFLGPLALLILLCFAGIRSQAAGRIRWSPLRILLSTTLWVLVLIWLAAPPLTAVALAQREDRLTPESLRPLARQIVRRTPRHVVQNMISVLTSPETRVMAPTVPMPGPVQEPAPSAPALVVPLPPPPPPPFAPQARRPKLPKQLGQWASPSVTAATPAVASREARARLAEEETVDLLARALWNLISSQGEDHIGLPPLLPVVAAAALAFGMIPLVVLGMLVSLVVMGLVLWALRASEFIRLVMVRVEVPRYTLRGPRPPSEV